MAPVQHQQEASDQYGELSLQHQPGVSAPSHVYGDIARVARVTQMPANAGGSVQSASSYGNLELSPGNSIASSGGGWGGAGAEGGVASVSSYGLSPSSRANVGAYNTVFQPQ